MEPILKTMIGSKGIDLRKFNFEVPACLINQNIELIKNPKNHFANNKNNNDPFSKIQGNSVSENFLNIGNSNYQVIEKLIDSINFANMEEEKKELSNMFNQLAKPTSNSFSHEKNSKNSPSMGSIKNNNPKNYSNSRSNSFYSDLSLNDSVVEASGLKSYIGKKRKKDQSCSEKTDSRYIEPSASNPSNNLSSLISIKKNFINNLNNHGEMNNNIDGFHELNPMNYNLNRQPLYNFVNSNNHLPVNNQGVNHINSEKNMSNAPSNNMSNIENIAHILQKLNSLTNSNLNNNLKLKSDGFSRSPVRNKYVIPQIDPTRTSPLINNNFHNSIAILNPNMHNYLMKNYNNNLYQHRNGFSQTPPPIGMESPKYNCDLNNEIRQPVRNNSINKCNNQSVDGYNYPNINSHDNMLEKLSDDEDRTKYKYAVNHTNLNSNKVPELNESNQIIPSNYNIPKQKIEEIFNKNVSYMNKEEIKEVNKIMGDGRNLRQFYKQEKMKLLSLTSIAAEASQNSKREESEISSIKVNDEFEEGEVLFHNTSNIFSAFEEKEPSLTKKEYHFNVIPNQPENMKEQILPNKEFEIPVKKFNNKPNKIFTEGYSDILRREMEDYAQSFKREETKNSHINQSTNGSKLNNLLISRKSKVFFKLIYKGKELLAEFNIIFKSIEKSVMKVDYFLDVDEFLNLKLIKDDFQISSKLEISNPNLSDEDTRLFFEKMGDKKMALVEDSEEFYCVIYSKNSRIISNMELTEHISSREDIILILKILKENIKEKIKGFIKDMITNKSRPNTTNCELANLSKESNKENIYSQNDEISIRENKLKELVKEIEELRQFKYKNKEITEELLKKKESETKYKYKLYYDKILENELQKFMTLQKEKDTLYNENFNIQKDFQISLKKVENLEIEIIKFQNEILMQKERILTLEKQTEDALKNEKLYMNYYREAFENLKEIQKRLAETEGKLAEAEKQQKKIISQDSSLVKIGDFLIEEVPCLTTTGTEFSEKIYELQTKLESVYCIICLVKVRDCLFIDCNHLICCFNCIKDKIEKLIGKNKKKKIKTGELELKGQLQCPICKKDNFTFKKLFVA